MKEQYIRNLQIMAEERKNGYQIENPWETNMSSWEIASAHAQILDSTYGGGHPGSLESIKSLAKKIDTGQILTWLIMDDEIPIGMANISQKSTGTVEVLRWGTISDVERPGVSSVIYQHIADLLSQSELSDQIWAIDGDIRLAASIDLPNRGVIDTGAKTQHINKKMGIHPMLLCVPRYQVHPVDGNPHQEVFLQSRKYLDQSQIKLDESIYTPNVDHLGIADIAIASYENVWGIVPRISHSSKKPSKESQLLLEQTAGIHYSTLHLSGNLSPQNIWATIEDGLSVSRFIEVIIPNHPGNIDIQSILYQLNCIPMGVLPGVMENHIGEETSTTIHFGIARDDIRKNIPPIELARDYKDSKIEALTKLLWNWWKQT